jgi:hypothetical protein
VLQFVGHGGGADTPAGQVARLHRRISLRLRRALSAVGLGLSSLVLEVEAAWAQTTVPPGGGGGYSPNAAAGPGGPQLQQLVNWGAGMILIACAGAMAFHAGRWGWGSQQHNMAKVQDGKEGVARAALVAGVVAAIAGLIRFATGLGGQVQ